MTNLYHNQLANDNYRSSSKQGLSDREVMAEALLYLLTKLHLAREAAQRKAFEEMLVHTSKVLRVVAVLRDTLQQSGALRDAEAGQAASHIFSVYSTVFTRVPNVLRTKDIYAEFSELIALLLPVYQTWRMKESAEPTGVLSHQSLQA